MNLRPSWLGAGRRTVPTSGRPAPGGKIAQLLGTMFLIALGGGLIGNIIWQPSKRNLETLAAIIFVAIVLIADPFRALLFTLVVLPFPAYTSVGSTSTLLVFALMGLVMMKARQYRKPTPFVRRDADLAILGFGLMLLLSLYSQPLEEFAGARRRIVGMISGIALYYLLVYLTTSTQRFWTVVRAFQVIVLLQAALGLYQFYFPDKQLLPAFFHFSRQIADAEEIRRGTVRVQGTFAGYELYAEYLAISSVFQFFLWRRAKGLVEKTFWFASQLCVIAAIFATATRGGFIVLIFGYAYMTAVGNRAVPRRTFLMIGFLSVAAFYLAYNLLQPLVEFMVDRLVNIGSADSSMQSRSVVLRQAFDAIANKPFLGHGIAIPAGTFRGGVDSNIHNLYVTLAYSLGLPGLMAFVWFMAILFRSTWRGMRDRLVSSELRQINLVTHTALVMFLLDEIKIEFTRQALTMHVGWYWFAMAFIAWRLTYRPPAVHVADS